MKTVIAGNGIVGLTTAFRLGKRLGPRDEIIVVGPAARPGSATLAAAAMLNSFAEVEVGGLDSELDQYRFELSRLAGRRWPEFLGEIVEAAGARLPPACANIHRIGGGCFDTGTYVVNNAAADDLDDENFDAILRTLARFEEPHQLVSPREIPNYDPEQRTRATRALFIPNEGWMNPRLAVAAVEAALAADPRVTFVEGSIEKMTKGASGVESVVLEDGRRVDGDRFLLATGATAGEVLRRSNLGIVMQRIFYGRGVSIELKSLDHPPQKCVRTPNRGLACGIYSVPLFVSPELSYKHLIIGASNHVMATASPLARLSAVESLTRSAIEQINRGFYCAELVRINVGWRPTSQDTYPLVGPTSIANLVIATGTKRDGFHLSPLLSDYVSSMLLGEAVDSRFAVFAPERKLIRGLTREQAIAKGVRHQISTSYQHGFSPSKSRMPEEIAEMYRADLERLHDRVGARDWGIPPEMFEVYRKGEALADGAYPQDRR
jgi:glycine/D-amino acid oxidase-like deaminating enzyme